LRWWRRRRGLSQLELAGRAGISQRHLSFIELGRAAPSRVVVLRLADALGLPMRQQNALLLAAGFAPIWRETQLGEPELVQIERALEHMLTQQEPFPAVVVDRRWNLLRTNASAVRLVEFFTSPLDPDTPINLADALVAPDVLKPFLVNWRDIVRHFIASVEADAWEDGTRETAALLDRLMSYDGVRAALRGAPSAGAGGPVLPMIFAKDDVTLQLFTSIATLGTPRNVTLDELRIENFFPMDEETEATFKLWALA
jgi:transcriptional regulator with XRE-family HTH domain